KQRVGVAQAIIGRPSLLILVEPTNGLDPAQTELLRALIRQISESATIILSTHIMQEVEAVCDRALILRHGRLAVDARLDELTDTRRIRLQTSASHEQVSAVLKSQPWFHKISDGVSGIERPGASSAGKLIIELQQDAAVDMSIPACATALVGAGIPILGLQPVTHDLQSLFLDVNAADWQPASESSREIDHVA
ncbi:MAG: ABC transporter ATP-binding protein, partial [Granulosicoccus sp.]|nr:ABC transporter ATP-binding protein [Granulosicoccus sp.]